MSITGYQLLVMEVAPLGNLKQFLESRANETYYNVTSSQSLEMNFINQIIEGIEAIYNRGVSIIVVIL